MSWKQLYASIFLGALLGVFSTFGYLATSFPPGKEVAHPALDQTTQVPVLIDEIIPTEEQAEVIPEETVKALQVEKTINPINQSGKSAIYPKAPLDHNHQGITLKHGNKELNNYNIMFFGIEDKKLQMLTVYSINEQNNWKSGTVFIPTHSLVPGTVNQSIEEYFYQNGAEKVKRLVEKLMEINISYFVEVDRNLLLEVEPYLDPIYVDGEKVNLAQIFTKEITPEDEIILASLLKNLTQPSIYFGVLPKLVLTCKQYINTDFELNWPNLWVHYQIAKNIDTSAVTKKIIFGKVHVLRNKKYWIPTQDAWWNMVYEVTK